MNIVNSNIFEDCMVKTYENIFNTNNSGQLITVKENIGLGFNYPYILFIPTNINHNSTIIVEGSNSRESKKINSSDNINDIIQESIDDVRKSFIGSNNPIYKINEEILNYPVLYPLFPRLVYKGIPYYNHMLSSNSMFSSKDEENLKKLGLYRTDLQLIKMIEDSKRRLLEYGLNIDEKIIINGFSSSAKFANRFTLLHPEIVKYTIAGGIGGTITLPIREINGEKLLWPVGIGNVEEITNEKLEIYKSVPQYYYQGMQDDKDPYESNENGTCKYPQILQDEEAKQLYKFLGKFMNEARWDKTKQIISSLGYNIKLESLEGGHNPNIARDAISKIITDMYNEKKSNYK
ncbi:MAG TPA: hypothetical protein PKY25_02020 [Bacilli bacterium]|nr:hypothetical protein [Bacilli bacterium]